MKFKLDLEYILTKLSIRLVGYIVFRGWLTLFILMTE